MGTIVYVDGFDDYTAAQATEQGWSQGFNNMQTGIFGGQCARHSQATITRNIPSDSRYTFSLAWRHVSGTGSNAAIFREGSTVHATCSWSGNTLYFNGASFTGASVSASSGIWYHIEIDLTVANSPNGAYTFKVNQQVIGSATGIDTQNGGTGVINTFCTSTSTNQICDIDDLVLIKGGGSVGDCRVITQYPSGNGQTNFAGSDGNQTDNYLLVDEAAGHNSDTDYVVGSVRGSRETYDFPDLGVTGSVRCVSIVPVSKRDGTAARRTTSVIHRGLADYDGWSELSTGANYVPNAHLYENDPLTGASWSIADINSSWFGVCVDRRSFVLSAVVA